MVTQIECQDVQAGVYSVAIATEFILESLTGVKVASSPGPVCQFVVFQCLVHKNI